MSNWTHVAAVIRIDDFRVFDAQTPDWDEIFGKEILFDEPYDNWEDADNHPEKYLPMGSEGSLRKSVWTNPNKCNSAAYTVSIFGDLRDHDDPDEIIKWFKKKCSKLSVRQASIVVTNIVNGTRSWYASLDEEQL